MRRLPIYFLIDTSESMIGEPIEQVQKGMRTIVQELRNDPYALETVWVSVIAFAGKAASVSPLTELFKFYPPELPIGDGTAIGRALDFLMSDIDKSVNKTTMEAKGDWKPIIFLFTDGTPTDNYRASFERWNARYRKACNLVAISIGDNADTNLLGQISDNVLRLADTDEHSFNQFFKWVTASIKTSSVSVTDYNDDNIHLAPTDGINLEKVDTSIQTVIDENFVVLHGKCQNTGKDYLVKYAKRIRPYEGDDIISLNMRMQGINMSDFKLVGAYPIDGKSFDSMSDKTSTHRNINTQELIGQPTCPCCGNQFAVVVCECGNIFCVGEDSRNKCPWCGLEGTLGTIEEGGTNVNRGRG